jgi:hypothetical protein
MGINKSHRRVSGKAILIIRQSGVLLNDIWRFRGRCELSGAIHEHTRKSTKPYLPFVLFRGSLAWQARSLKLGQSSMLHSLLTIIVLFTVAAVTAHVKLHSVEADAPQPVRHHSPTPQVITLQRTVCFGTCPEYKLTILADGRVLYEGISYVKTKGKAWGRITRQQLKELISEFNKINYSSLADSYTPGTKNCPQSMTDMPAATTSLTRNGKSKTVIHYHGCRGLPVLDQLTQLENKIDEAVDVNKWIK